MKFKGKIGLWFYALIIFLNGMFIHSIFDHSDGFWIMLLVTIFCDLIFIPMMVRNYIIIEDNTLTMVLGWSKDSMDIAEIREVYPTHNPIASGALSLDRVVITSRRNEIMCSVQDKRGLFLALKEANPRIIFSGKQII